MDEGPAAVSSTELVEDLFRKEYAHLVSALTRVLGPSSIPLAEDVVHDALVSAMHAWRFGLPQDPKAWIIRAARNRAIDIIRREQRHRSLLAELAATAALAGTIEAGLAPAAESAHRAPAPCARTRSPDRYRPAAGPAPDRSRSPAHSRSPPADVPSSAPAARPAGGNSPATVPRSRAQLRLPLMCCKRHAAHRAAVHFPHPGHPWPGQGRQSDQRGSARTIAPVLPFSARFVAAHRTNRDAHATLEPLE